MSSHHPSRSSVPHKFEFESQGPSPKACCPSLPIRALLLSPRSWVLSCAPHWPQSLGTCSLCLGRPLVPLHSTPQARSNLFMQFLYFFLHTVLWKKVPRYCVCLGYHRIFSTQHSAWHLVDVQKHYLYNFYIKQYCKAQGILVIFISAF